MNKIIFIITIFIATNTWAASRFESSFILQNGDLLFQDLACGTLCDSITDVTYGINKSNISHVAIVTFESNLATPIVIEAIGKGVVKTPLDQFLARSHDKNHQPMVILARLKPAYRYLIPNALFYIKQQLGKPYNETFYPNHNESFYCSQLIYEAFKHANNQQPFFATNHMDFTDPKTGKINSSWQEYFDHLHVIPPQGKIGTNPGMLSRESSLEIIYFYGQLRRHLYLSHR